MKNTFENVCRRAHNNNTSYCEFTVNNSKEPLYWFAVGTFGNDHKARPGIRGFGKNDRLEEIEMWIKTRTPLVSFISWKRIIENYNDSIETETTEDGLLYCYHLSYVPKQYISDAFTSLYPLFADNESPAKEKLNFDKMYIEYDRKYNPYPVQMSRADAFLHAFNDGLISEAVLTAARDYYGDLWFYVGD